MNDFVVTQIDLFTESFLIKYENKIYVEEMNTRRQLLINVVNNIKEENLKVDKIIYYIEFSETTGILKIYDKKTKELKNKYSFEPFSKLNIRIRRLLTGDADQMAITVNYIDDVKLLYNNPYPIFITGSLFMFELRQLFECQFKILNLENRKRFSRNIKCNETEEYIYGRKSKWVPYDIKQHYQITYMNDEPSNQLVLYNRNEEITGSYMQFTSRFICPYNMHIEKYVVQYDRSFDMIPKLDKVRCLIVTSTGLKKFNLNDFPSLIILDLQLNKLIKFEGSSDVLQTLKLKGNKDLKGVLRNLPKLKHLDLVPNQLDGIIELYI